MATGLLGQIALGAKKKIRWVASLSRDSNPGWGDGVARFVDSVWLVSLLCFVGNFNSAPFTYHAIGYRCRAALGEKKNPGGIGVARFWLFGFLLVFVCFLAIFKSVCFAFHATGLDAMQRLEQKK